MHLPTFLLLSATLTSAHYAAARDQGLDHPSSPTPSIHSTFLVRPSQTPSVQPYQVPARGYRYNYPENTPTQAREPAPQEYSQSQQPQMDDIPALLPSDDDVSPGASGGVAPIEPMSPDSQVVPPPLSDKPNFGKDEGNTFCIGQCFEDESDAKCAKPYALAVYKPAKGCYMCCFTSDF
ncbi:unnamed protein product [Penicillium glandicola]